MSLTNLMLVEFVLKALAKGTRYWYGTFGLKASTSLYNSKKGQYPSHYTSSRAAQYKADIAAGKWVADCVGLIKWFFWSLAGTRDTKYADGFPDVSADQFIASYCDKTGSIGSLPEIPGLVLWCKGHIGVYIGNGYAIEARGFAYGVVKTKVKDRSWTKWGRVTAKYLTYVDGVVDVGAGGDPVTESELGGRILRYRAGVSLMNGPDVQLLQKALTVLGFGQYLGTDGADGWFGRMTDTAVRAFQKAYSLAVDGEYGPKSHAKLTSLLDITQWHEPDNTDPLTEDDLPPPPVYEQSGEELDEPDAPDNDEVPEPDAPMGAGSVNPYPIPTALKKLGSKGQAVRWIQQQLIFCGITEATVSGKSKALEIDGDFGPITEAAVKAFQRANLDASGKKLVVDGEVGEKTRGALAGGEQGASDPVQGQQPPSGTTGRIIDISEYDGKPDWAKVTALTGKDRIDFVFIRVQASKLDAYLAHNIAGCKKYGIRYGVYAYLTEGTADGVRKQVEQFIQRARAAGAEPESWVLDIEKTDGKGKPIQSAAVVDAALAHMRKLLPGESVGGYLAHHLYANWSKQAKKFDFRWVPRYNEWKTPPAHPYDLWQGDGTRVVGMRGYKAGDKYTSSNWVDYNRLKKGLALDELLRMRAA